MVPAFEPGDIAVINPRLPVKNGTDVILTAGELQGEFRASIKRLERSDAKHRHLGELNPPAAEGEFSWLKRDCRRPCARRESITADRSAAAVHRSL